MRFANLIKDFGAWQVQGPTDNKVLDITDDTRCVTPGSCFVARKDASDRWRQYVSEALEKGAVAVVTPEQIELPDAVAGAFFHSVNQQLAGRLAARFFDHPAKRLKLIGITGTNGKTTVATLVQYLLNAAHEKCGLIGTVFTDTGDDDGPTPASLTTPGAIELQRLFTEMVSHGCTCCAMEVSSHALDQGRVDGLEFAAAVFTNLTQDHLDYHVTMEAYAKAKAKLFDLLKVEATAAINCEDVGLKKVYLQGQTSDGVLCAVQDEVGHADASARAIEPTASGSRATFQGRWGSFEAMLPLAGSYNLMNALQALVVAHSLISWRESDWGRLIESCPQIPGRLESIDSKITNTSNGIPTVLVDYAHTPDALQTVLATLQPLTKGRLICVFGCGGDRDRTKRPKMAGIACEFADTAMLTSDNPRREDPQQILNDALAGLSRSDREKVVVQIDRAEAIRVAVMEAGVHDTVLIAGKGHEDYQIIADADSPTGTRKIHFDDREQAAAALQLWVEQNP